MKRIIYFISLFVCMILCGCEKVDKQVESTEEISIEYPEGFGQTTEEKPIKEIEELNNTASTEEQKYIIQEKIF